jgi:hypothetical protein
MRRHYWPSLLILRGKRKRRRIRVRRGSANDAVRDQRLSDLEWAEDRREREGSKIVSVWLQMSAFGYMVSDLQQSFREVKAVADLNGARISLIEAREVPGWTAKEKRMAFDLTVANSEEIEILREWARQLMERARRLEDKVTDVARAVGEEPSE